MVLDEAVPHSIKEHVEVDKSDAAGGTLHACKATVVRTVDDGQPHVAFSQVIGKGGVEDT